MSEIVIDFSQIQQHTLVDNVLQKVYSHTISKWPNPNTLSEEIKKL